MPTKKDDKLIMTISWDIQNPHGFFLLMSALHPGQEHENFIIVESQTFGLAQWSRKAVGCVFRFFSCYCTSLLPPSVSSSKKKRDKRANRVSVQNI